MAIGSVFISYSSDARPIVLQLIDELEKLDVRVFTREQFVKGGVNWRVALEDAVTGADLAVIFLSESSRKQGQLEEVSEIRSREIPEFPVLVSGDLSILESYNLAAVQFSKIADPIDIYNTATEIANQLNKPIIPFTEVMRNRGFSDGFIELIKRRAQELNETTLTLYYSDNLSLQDTVEIDKALNQFGRSIIKRDNRIPNEVKNLAYHEKDIFSVTSFSHPASTEIVFEISSTYMAVATSSPHLDSLLISLTANVLYDAAKLIHKRIFGIKRRENSSTNSNVEEQFTEMQTSQNAEKSVTQEDKTYVKKVTRTEKFIFVSGAGIIWGREVTESEERSSSGTAKNK